MPNVIVGAENIFLEELFVFSCIHAIFWRQASIFTGA
jgi:hypothetical protein